MLDSIRYVNHLGESFSTAENGIFARYSDLRDYEYKYETQSNRISRIYREPKTKSFPLVIVAESDEAGVAARHRIFEVAERDVLDEVPGRLYIGDYYLIGYIIGSKKGDYLAGRRIMSNELTFLAEREVWRREATYHLSAEEIVDNRRNIEPMQVGYESIGQPLPAGVMLGEFPHDYFKRSEVKTLYPQFDYAHDYVRSYGKSRVHNPSFAPCDFKMEIYGFCVNPRVVIGGHVYEVAATIYDGERVEIDSVNRTVTKIGRLGDVTNLFNARGKTQSIFQRIPMGWNAVSWPGTYRVAITLYDERSEPIWN